MVSSQQPSLPKTIREDSHTMQTYLSLLQRAHLVMQSRYFVRIHPTYIFSNRYIFRHVRV